MALSENTIGPQPADRVSEHLLAPARRACGGDSDKSSARTDQVMQDPTKEGARRPPCRRRNVLPYMMDLEPGAICAGSARSSPCQFTGLALGSRGNGGARRGCGTRSMR